MDTQLLHTSQDLTAHVLKISSRHSTKKIIVMKPYKQKFYSLSNKITIKIILGLLFNERLRLERIIRPKGSFDDITKLQHTHNVL